MDASDFISYGGTPTHITEAVSILQCNGLTTDQIFRWLEYKLRVGRYTVTLSETFRGTLRTGDSYTVSIPLNRAGCFKDPQ